MGPTSPALSRSGINNTYEKKRKRSFQSHWGSEFPWVVHDQDSETMYCGWCKKYPGIADMSCNLFVGVGGDKFRRQNLQAHLETSKHKMVSNRWESDKQREGITPVQTLFHKYVNSISHKCQETLTFLFNTAFYVAQSKIAFREFHKLCGLQKKNGVDFGQNYKNDKAVKGMILSIADVEKTRITELISNCRFFCVLADGSTDSAILEQESVHVRFLNSVGEPETVFAGLVQLEHGNSVGVLSGIDKALDSLNVNIEGQKSKLVHSNLDGAAVNMGKKVE